MKRVWTGLGALGLAACCLVVLQRAGSTPPADARAGDAADAATPGSLTPSLDRLDNRHDAIAAAKAAARRDAAPARTIKPTAGISVGYRFGGVARAGLPLEIVLSIRPQSPLREAELSLGGSNGLVVTSPLMAVRLPDLAAGEATEYTVTVLPVVAEALYLHVGVAGQLGGLPQARSLDVPIRLAPAAVPAAKLTVDAGGRPLRSFRARERQR
jgi:hypothetical protein